MLTTSVGRLSITLCYTVNVDNHQQRLSYKQPVREKFYHNRMRIEISNKLGCFSIFQLIGRM